LAEKQWLMLLISAQKGAETPVKPVGRRDSHLSTPVSLLVDVSDSFVTF